MQNKDPIGLYPWIAQNQVRQMMLDFETNKKMKNDGDS